MKEQYIEYLMKSLSCCKGEAKVIYKACEEEAKEYDSTLEFCLQLAVARLI